MVKLDLAQIQFIRELLSDHILNRKSVCSIEWLNFMEETLQEFIDTEESIIKVLRG